MRADGGSHGYGLGADCCKVPGFPLPVMGQMGNHGGKWAQKLVGGGVFKHGKVCGDGFFCWTRLKMCVRSYQAYAPDCLYAVSEHSVAAHVTDSGFRVAVPCFKAPG